VLLRPLVQKSRILHRPATIDCRILVQKPGSKCEVHGADAVRLARAIKQAQFAIADGVAALVNPR
jgi:hypothetical protein